MKALPNAASLKLWLMSEIRICDNTLQWRFPRRASLVACIVTAFLLIGCSHQGERRTGLAKAEGIASQIHTNMSFGEISKIIPLGTNNCMGVISHGGDWYQVELQDGYYLQLRFNHPVGGNGVHESLLNLPPRLRKHDGVR